MTESELRVLALQEEESHFYEEWIRGIYGKHWVGGNRREPARDELAKLMR